MSSPQTRVSKMSGAPIARGIRLVTEMPAALIIAVSAMLATCAIPSPARAAAASDGGPQVQVRTRYNVNSPDGIRMLSSYARGVAAMQAITDSTNPLSWSYQSAIHGTAAPDTHPAWRSCQHGSWYFLSWHRMFVYYLERIVRGMSADTTFTLPYWDYKPASTRALPSAFWQPSNATNSLYTVHRDSLMNLGYGLPDSDVQDSLAMQSKIFWSTTNSGNLNLSFGGLNRTPNHYGDFFGYLEMSPHNFVHGAIGGWMLDVNTAAQDPIFWLHHSNIDRLWNQWIALGVGRTDPADSSWLHTSFTFFDYDHGHAVPVTMTGAQVTSTVAMGYRYDTDPPQAPVVAAADPGRAQQVALQRSAVTVARGREQDVRLTERPSVVHLVASPAARTRLLAALSDRRRHVHLHLADFRLSKAPGLTYEVYLNLPASRTSPRWNGPHYVGNLDLFGMAMGAHHDHGTKNEVNAVFEVTDLLRRQRRSGVWKDGNLTVTLFPRGLVPPPGAPPAPPQRPASEVVIGRFFMTRQ
jgi:hypothetical protein